MSLPLGTKPDLALSTAIRSLRWKKGLTRERLAYDSGLTNGTVARIELGQACPSWESVRRIAAAFQMPTSELVIEVEAVERTDAHKVRVEIREREKSELGGEVRKRELRRLGQAKSRDA